MEAFGYRGDKDFAHKSDGVIAQFEGTHPVGTGAQSKAYSQGKAAMAGAGEEAAYIAFLNEEGLNAFGIPRCGHPDYSHHSNRNAQKNFDRYL